jgi:hypothetical protein
MKSSFLIILLGFCCFTLSAQNEVTFEVFVDAKKIVADSYFELSFTLKNAEGSQFRPPSFRDFIVVSGPSRSMRRSIINGQRSMEMGFSYTLQPRQTGRFTIGAASIVADGKNYKTEPVTLEVVEGRTSAASEEQSFFVRAVPSTEEAYIGQQINLNYKLFTTVDIESYNIIEESDYPGFYAEDLTRFETRTTKEIIDRIQYVSRTLKSVALYPQQAGKLTVDPMQLQLGVVLEDNRRPGNFFFSRPVKRVPANTPPVELIVKPLPSGAPESFSGAVGRYSMSSGISRNTITTDDVLSVILTITGTGDVKRVQAPELVVDQAFEVYDPKVKEESTYELSEEVRGRKSFEYLLVPKKTGQYDITPAFSYFDPETGEYATIGDITYNITIKQGSNVTSPAISNLEKAEEDYLHPIKSSARLRKGGAPFWGSDLFWILYILPILGMLGIAGYRQIRKRRLDIDPVLLRKKQAEKVARKRLETANAFLKENNPRQFYDEISKAMIGYVCNKLNMPLSAISKDNVKYELEKLEVAPEAVERFMKILHNCEMALFAGKDNAEAMQETYDNTLQVLAGIESKIK